MGTTYPIRAESAMAASVHSGGADGLSAESQRCSTVRFGVPESTWELCRSIPKRPWRRDRLWVALLHVFGREGFWLDRAVNRANRQSVGPDQEWERALMDVCRGFRPVAHFECRPVCRLVIDSLPSSVRREQP